MVDLSTTIAAKSDQLNADDLMGGPITVKITRVAGMNDKEQPIAIYYEGDAGKPYKPGKSMRRVLVNFWGKDGEVYVGRWLTLFRDPEVAFGGIKVGGIRIDAMSHIAGDSEMALAVTRGAKRRFEVKVLRPPEEARQRGPSKTPDEQADAYIDAIRGLDSALDIAEYEADDRRKTWREKLAEKHPAIATRIREAVDKRLSELAGDGEPEAGRSDEQHGDQFPGDDNDDAFPE